jgi:hypothetical protein
VRLAILDSGHSLGTKALFAFIGAVSRQPVLDAVKVVKYRADFYGNPMSRIAQDVMRGPSAWSVGDRELMAALSRRRMSVSGAQRLTLRSPNEHTAM